MVPLFACLTLNRILDTLQEALVVHGYYVVGVTNFGNIADLRTSPWCVKTSVSLDIDFKPEDHNRTLRIQALIGGMYVLQNQSTHT